MWSKLFIGRCFLQRWWLVVTQPNGRSREKLSEILKRASQLICSIPAGQETDKITAVYSWSSHIKYNYFKCSAMFSTWCAGAGPRALHQHQLGLGTSALRPPKSATCRNKAPCPSSSLIHSDPACSSVPMLFYSPSGIFLNILPLTRSLFCARLVAALRWLAFYVHAVLAFPYHMVILMLPFASIILFVAAWTS